MEFDINRVYTAVNADEVKAGSKVICANTKQGLMSKVEFNEITELKDVLPDCYTHRFQAYFNEDLINYNLCYLIEEPSEKKLKWTDLKIGDVLKKKGSNEVNMVTGIREETKTNEHILLSYWTSDKELEEWEKVEENRSVEE